MRSLLTVFLLLLGLGATRAADNEIFLHNGAIRIGAPADWVILAHNPTGNRTVIAFQIFGNDAEAGTSTSTNLTVSTFSLKDAETGKAFSAPQTKRTAENTTTRDYEVWSIREWDGEQDGTKYHIEDARMVLKKQDIGILVRLAWPLLPNNPEGYTDRMNFLFKMTLDSIARKNLETP